MDGSSPGPAKPAASATTPPQQPASKLPAACGFAYAGLYCPNGPQPGPHSLSGTCQIELRQHTWKCHVFLARQDLLKSGIVGRDEFTVPAGAFTWLNRHHDPPAARRDGGRDMRAGTGRLTQSARQQSGKLGSAPPGKASPQPRRQAESRPSSQQPQPEQQQQEQNRAFKSTDAGWRSDSNYWKSTASGKGPQTLNGQSASVPKWGLRAEGSQANSSQQSPQQSAQHKPANSSQAPRLR